MGLSIRENHLGSTDREWPGEKERNRIRWVVVNLTLREYHWHDVVVQLSWRTYSYIEIESCINQPTRRSPLQNSIVTAVSAGAGTNALEIQVHIPVGSVTFRNLIWSISWCDANWLYSQRLGAADLACFGLVCLHSHANSFLGGFANENLLPFCLARALLFFATLSLLIRLHCNLAAICLRLVFSLTYLSQDLCSPGFASGPSVAYP